MTLGRREFLAGIAVGLAGAPALAQDIVGSIIGQLRDQGFGSVQQETTLLGRVRIIAERNDGRREIIVNPRTGEILRDLWTPKAGGIGTVQIINEGSGKGGGSNGDDDEDDDEDDEDGSGGDDEDDDDEDDSEDGGNSGSGGGGGGSGGDGGGDDDDDDED